MCLVILHRGFPAGVHSRTHEGMRGHRFAPAHQGLLLVGHPKTSPRILSESLLSSSTVTPPNDQPLSYTKTSEKLPIGTLFHGSRPGDSHDKFTRPPDLLWFSVFFLCLRAPKDSLRTSSPFEASKDSSGHVSRMNFSGAVLQFNGSWMDQKNASR